MSTTERADDPSMEPDDWVTIEPAGPARTDLPPPFEAAPVDLDSSKPHLPADDHVPFDMDFIAKTLAAVIGGDPSMFAPPAAAPQLNADVNPEPVVDHVDDADVEMLDEDERGDDLEPWLVDAWLVDPPDLREPLAPTPPAPASRPPSSPAPTAPRRAAHLPSVPAPPPPPPFAAHPAPPPPPPPASAEDIAAAAALLDADGRLFAFAPPKQARGDTSPVRGVRIALVTLLRQRRRMLLSIIAVALGVGYLAGSLSLLQRVGAGLAAQAGADSERADLVIEGTIASDSPLQQVRKLVPDSMVEQVRAIPGVAAVEPRLESKSTLIIGSKGQPVVGLGLTERPLGANYPQNPSLNPYRFVGPGRPPTTGSEVVIDSTSAKAAGVKSGDTVLIAGKVDLKQFTVTGIVEMKTGTLPAGSSLALFETTAARPLFDLGPDDNAIAIKLSPGADRDAVVAKVRAMAFGGTEVSTRAEYADHRQASLGKSFTLIRALLVGFAALALVVGSFTVANSMALLFDHRRRGFAMLRLLGASPRQLVGAATAESLIGGVMAGVVGLVLGLGVGVAIERLIQSLGTPLPVAGPALTWWIPIVAVVVGAVVTVATALSPARQASKTPPVHAVTGADDRPPDRPRLVTAMRWLATVLALGIGAAVAGGALGGSQIALVAGGSGVAVGVVLVILPRLLSGIVGFVTAALLGKSVALRRMSTLRSRQARTRAASTTAALLLSAAVVTSLTVLSSSFLESIEGQVGRAITADLVVDSATFTTGGLSADLIPLLREEPGVAAVSGWRPGNVVLGGSILRAGGVDGATMFKVLNLDVEGTTPPSAGLQDVVISRALADAQGIEVGQTIPVGFQNQVTIPMRVRAIFRSDVRLLLGDVLVDSTVMAANLPLSIDVFALVKLAPNAPANVRSEITTIANKYGAPHVLEPDQLVSERAELLRGFARVIQWMLAFSIVLALIGVANTLQLGVNERRRELGLIRAVGATREQVLRLVMAEAGALSLVGTAFGMGIGAAAAWASIKALSAFGLDRFVAPVGTLLVIAIVAIGLGLVGAILPALRASKVPLLDAIADSSDGDDRRRARPPLPASSTRAPQRSTDGSNHSSGAIVGAPNEHVVAGAFPTPNPEVQMALRCYNCGNEPGDGESCVACGAAQTVTPVGMFTLRPDADAVTVNGTNGSNAGDGRDIVDAAVVEDGVVVEPAIVVGSATSAPPAPPQSSPPPYVATTPTDPEADLAHQAAPADTYGVSSTIADETRQSLGSIFDGRPTPSQAHDPMRSPFGQHAAAEEPSPIEPEIADVAPAPAKHGIFSAGTAETAAPEADWPAPATTHPAASAGPPPAFARAMPAGGSGAGRAPAGPSTNPTLPDAHGLAASVARLSHAAQDHGLVPFSIAGALLGANERVLGAVAGTSLGMPTVVVVTESRALVVSDRRYVPDVEIFELGPDLTIHGRHANEQASLTFGEHGRLVTIDQITDVGLAVELANTARNRTAGGDF